MTEKQKQWDEMQATVDGLVDALGYTIEPEVKDLVVCLNLLGCPTNASCQGHTFSEDRGLPFPWVSVSAENNSDMKEKIIEYYEIHDSIRTPLNAEFKERYGDIDQWPASVGAQWTKEFFRRIELDSQFETYKNIEHAVEEKTNTYREKLQSLLVTFYAERKDDTNILYGIGGVLSRLEPVRVPEDLQETFELANRDDRIEARKKIDSVKYDRLLAISQQEIKKITEFLKNTYFFV